VASFSLSGTDSSKFNIDTSTGQITLKTSAFTPETRGGVSVYDLASSYSLTLNMADGQGNTSSTNLSVAVMEYKDAIGNTYIQRSAITGTLTAVDSDSFSYLLSGDTVWLSANPIKFKLSVTVGTENIQSLSKEYSWGLSQLLNANFASLVANDGTTLTLSNSVTNNGNSTGTFLAQTGGAVVPHSDMSLFTLTGDVLSPSESVVITISDIAFIQTNSDASTRVDYYEDSAGSTSIDFKLSNTGTVTGTEASEWFDIKGAVSVAGGDGVDIFSLNGLAASNDITLSDFVSGTDVIDVSRVVTALGYTSSTTTQKGASVTAADNVLVNMTSAPSSHLDTAWGNEYGLLSTTLSSLVTELTGASSSELASQKLTSPNFVAAALADSEISSFDELASFYRALIEDDRLDGTASNSLISSASGLMAQIDNVVTSAFDSNTGKLHLFYDSNASAGTVELDSLTVTLGTSYSPNDLFLFPELIA